MPNYRRWQDRQVSLLGKLLLRRAVGDNLERLVWSDQHRPSLPNRGDFNISHAKTTVVCAVADQGRVGVDIETYRELEVGDLDRALADAERGEVMAHPEPARRLIEIWTFKEAVVKADGRGITLDLTAIDSTATETVVDDIHWLVQRIDLGADLCCHLASDHAAAVSIEWVAEGDLLAQP